LKEGILPTCTQITDALNVLASATTNQNILADLTGQTAVLTNIGTVESFVQLTAGGNASLKPSDSSAIDNKASLIVGVGRMHGVSSPTNDLGTVTVYLNNAGSRTAICSSTINFGGGDTDVPFIFSVPFVYDSVIQTITGSYNISFGSNTAVAGFSTSGVLSDADISFEVSAKFAQSVVANSLTLSQFKMQLV
jgi:hypothetical protein